MGLLDRGRCARDLFEKLERDAKKCIGEEVSSDNVFNFVISAYHLVEWIEKDSNVSSGAKEDTGRLREDVYFKICCNMANGVKHFVPKREKITSEQGFGCGRFGYGDYGIGEEEIRIKISDGEFIDALDLIEGVLKLYRDFFKKYNL